MKKYYSRRGAALVGCLFAPFASYAQTEAVLAAPAVEMPAEAPASGLTPLAVPAAEAAPVVAAASPASTAADTLSVDFPDEDIRNILRNVADLFELNIVMPDTLVGRTSIKLRDVTWRQIFKVVLAPVGYTFIEDGNIIKIVTNESLAAEPLSTEIFILNYARAEEIMLSVTALVDTASGGRVLLDKRINALIISERPSKLARISPVLKDLDKATDQVMIESKFVEVTDRDIKNLGVNWSSLNGYGVSAGPASRTYTQSVSRQNDGTFSSLNTDPRIPGANAAAGQALGLGGPLSPLPINQGAIDDAIANGDPVPTAVYEGGGSSTSVLTSADRIGRTTTAVFNANQFNVVLSALKTINDVKLVSNPTVVTLNNVEASINIGEQYPVPSYTYNSERGAFEVSGFDYKDIGVNLKVTPQVNNQGFIRLSIEPEVSVRNGTTSFGGASGAEIPIIATRKTKTQVSMKDGFTLGIGGLIENTSQKGETKVPVLGSLPLVGRLFSSKNHDVSNRNLLIFITAKTLSSEGAEAGEVFDPRVIRSMNLRKDELPGYRDGSDPFPPPPPEKEKAEKKKKKSLFGKKTEEAPAAPAAQ